MSEMMTGTLRDAATLVSEQVAHPYNIPVLLRNAAATIDDLRTQLQNTLTEVVRLRDAEERPSPDASRIKVVYIAGPYRAPSPWEVEQNIRRAEDVAVRVHKAGMMALCPHANSRHMEGVADDAHFLAGTMELMRRCDAVLLVSGWERSVGTCAEVVEAVRIGLPVIYCEDDGDLEWFKAKPDGYRETPVMQHKGVRDCCDMHSISLGA